MKKAFFLFLCLMVGAIQTTFAAERINWYTNYDEAVKAAQSSSKPMVLLFTGSDWCTWCIKLEEEALKTPEFADTVANKFIFVKLDFPLNRSQQGDMAAQNKRLQKQFGVQGYPTIIILDAKQRKIGSTGYRPGGGRQFGNHLLQMVEGRAAYQQKIDTLDQHQLTGVDLKILYEQANDLDREGDMQTLIQEGLASDQKQFFLLERYRQLAKQNQLYGDEALRMRAELLNSDPENARLTCYQVAIIDFEAASRTSKQSPPEVVVTSLLDYIDKFGSKDKENLWRLEMLISQVYYERNKLQEALHYARSSFEIAPPSAQADIACAIKSIQSLL